MEEVLKERLNVSCLKAFMQHEGFDPKQVEDEMERANKKSNELLARSIARWQKGVEDDAYLMPKMFDRWKYFVKMRKLVRWTLNNMENRLTPVKADMSWAFNKWKYSTGNAKGKLDGVTQAEKKVKMVSNQKQIQELLQ